MLWSFKIIFRGFCRFLIHGNSSYVVLYTQCLRYNICSTWFLDIRISTCLILKFFTIQYIETHCTCTMHMPKIHTNRMKPHIHRYTTHKASYVLSLRYMKHMHIIKWIGQIAMPDQSRAWVINKIYSRKILFEDCVNVKHQQCFYIHSKFTC